MSIHVNIDTDTCVLDIPPYNEKKAQSIIFPTINRTLDFVTAGKYSNLIADLNQNAHKKNACLYFHIPFCKSTCYFCIWRKIPYSVEQLDKYLKYLKKEALYYADTTIVKTSNIMSVNIGGGSPSVLTESQLEDLLIFIRNTFNLEHVEEFSMEGEVRTITKEKINIFKKYGGTRISFGLQTFNERIRKIQGLPKIDTLKNIMFMIRDAGFYVNVDFMVGLPESTMETLMEDLEKIKEYGIDAIDIYVYEHTPNNKNWTHLDEKLNFPTIEQKVDMFNFTQKYLTSLGYIQDTINHFYSNKNLHMLKYLKLFREYDTNIFGVGWGSRGQLENKTYRNITDIDEYCSERNDGSYMLPIENIREMKEEEIVESRFVQFPQNLYIDTKKINKNILNKYKWIIDSQKEKKLIIEEDGLIKLTELGKDWYQNVSTEFISDESEKRLMLLYLEYSFPNIDVRDMVV